MHVHYIQSFTFFFEDFKSCCEFEKKNQPYDLKGELPTGFVTVKNKNLNASEKGTDNKKEVRYK